MKILYVITGLGLGGAEKVMIQLAEKIKSLNHSIKIIYLTGNVQVQPNDKTIEIIGLNLNSAIDFVEASRKYRQVIYDFHPDVIHAHMIHANIFTRLNSIFLPRDIKLICSAHSSNEGGILRMLAYRLTNGLSDVLTNVSQEATQSFIKKKAVNASDIVTIYNGIDLTKFRSIGKVNNISKCKLKIDSNDKIILAVGRIEDPKDYPTLIKAVSLLSETTNNFKLLIAGEGTLRKDLEILINKLKVSDRVYLLGNRDDIPELMALSDLYVLSSKFEGLPTVLIEAMACGKFVVSTDCGGAREVIGDTGILVPIKDSKKLAAALDKALNLPSEDIELNSIKAMARAEKLFSIDKVINEWLKIYEEE